MAFVVGHKLHVAGSRPGGRRVAAVGVSVPAVGSNAVVARVSEINADRQAGFLRALPGGRDDMADGLFCGRDRVANWKVPVRGRLRAEPHKRGRGVS